MEKTMLTTQKKIRSATIVLLLAFALGACQTTDPANLRSGILDPVALWVWEKGGNVNKINAKINDDGETLIHLAAKEGRVDVLTWLKDRGVDINAKTKVYQPPQVSRIYPDGYTPMHLAAQSGRLEAMKWLKEQEGGGVDLNAKDDYGRTPLSLADTDEAKAWLRANGAK